MIWSSHEIDKALDRFVDKIDQGSCEGSSLFASSKLESNIAPAISQIQRICLDENQALLAHTMGPFQLIQVLGRGGFGTVFLAKETATGRNVALKWLHSEKQSARLRFFRESVISSELRHPALVPSFCYGEFQGKPYYAMEYVEGNSFAHWIRQGSGKKNEIEFVLDVALQMAEALAFLHRKNIVHRDFKPGNILIDVQGNARLSDLGLAELSGADDESQRAGTYPYMSPEQFRGEEPDVRSDLFSFGATFYEALSDRRAFPGASRAEIAHAILNLDPIPLRQINPRVSRSLGIVLSRCLAKQKAARYQNADELLQDLRRVRAGKMLSSQRRLLRFGAFSFASLFIMGSLALWYPGEGEKKIEAVMKVQMPQSEIRAESPVTRVPVPTLDPGRSGQNPVLLTSVLQTPVQSVERTPEPNSPPNLPSHVPAPQTKQTDLATAPAATPSTPPAHSTTEKTLHLSLEVFGDVSRKRVQLVLVHDGSLSVQITDPAMRLQPDPKDPRKAKFPGVLKYCTVKDDGTLIVKQELTMDFQGEIYNLAPQGSYSGGQRTRRIVDWSLGPNPQSPTELLLLVRGKP